MSNKYKYIVIGGSAGSFQVISKIIESLPENYPFAIILALHRLKHVRNGFVEALSLKSKLPISEPEDKESIKTGNIYLAPANYHLYVEPAFYFSLSTEPVVNHSRPSIDLTFKSAAHALKNMLVGIVLSGANRDGATGLKHVENYGGLPIVQNILESQVKTMPASAKKATKNSTEMTTNEIIEFLTNLNK